MDDLGKLIEYNTSCAPAFVQQAGLAAVQHGEAFTQRLVGELKASRDHLVRALSALPGVDVKAPPGAMYLFFSLPGAASGASSGASSAALAGASGTSRTSGGLALCKALVRDARLGLAPGSAFGPEGEGFVRWCYACDTARLDEGVARLRRFLDGRLAG
jgi:aspartate/methionine/tyrosine aminotransferase